MYVICDCRTPELTLKKLGELGYKAILMPPATYLQRGVASHPDMLFFIIKDRLFCHESYYQANKDLINQIIALSSLKLTLSSEPTDEKYPQDVLFNACLVGNKLICNKKTISKMISDYAVQNSFEIISVPQGYTKCSVCVVSDNAIITSDKAIEKACKKCGIDTLLIEEGYISLPDYPYGFIGGASGADNANVYFCGDLSLHPNSQEIQEFCAKHNKTSRALSDEPLYDVGTLIFI